MVGRIAISSDGILDACPVESSTTQILDPHLFFIATRNRKPLILKGAAQNWFGLNENSDATVKVFDAVEECEVDMLVALDGRNFLKQNLCSTFVVDLKTGMKSILIGDTIVPQSCVIRDSADQPQLSPKLAMERKYIRTYFDAHQNLLKEVDLNYLKRLVLCPEVENRDFVNSSSGDDFSPFKLKNIGLWISSEGCVTPLHFDLCHGFLAQIVGKKTFLLASSSDSSLLRYWRSKKTEELNGTTSPIDLSLWLDGNKAVRIKYPLIDETAWFIADLGPGDILYTPPGWWHYVISDTASVSVLIPFDPQPSVEILPMNVLIA